MAVGIVTRAVRSGQNVQVEVTVDETAAGQGLTGTRGYAVDVAIAELRALPSNAARNQRLIEAITAKRNTTLLEEVQVEGYLATIRGQQVTV